MWKTPECLMPLNHKICTKTKKLIFDIETINWIEPYALGVFDGKEFQVFEGKDCIKQFLDSFLIRKYRDYTAYAHNGGKFDFSFLLNEMSNEKFIKEYEIKFSRIGARIAQMKIRKKGSAHIWTLKDSFSLLPFSLKELTKNSDVTDKKGELDYKKINWKNYDLLRAEWLPYLIKDCKGLYQILDNYETMLMKKYSISLRNILTIAQLSMQVFRKNFLKVPIPNYLSREELVRQAYYGGRNEIFTMYGENLKYYDVNSLYPYVMHKYSMPVGQPVKSYTMTVEDFGIAYCEITTPKDIDIPLLPKRHSKKLKFLKGHWFGWYCTPELQKAKQLGYKIDVKYGLKFKEEQLFKGFIEDHYKTKQESKPDSTEYMNAKLQMNSLYGKFGQRRETQDIVMFPENCLGLEPLDSTGNKDIFWFKKTISKAKHILPAIAAFVTCYARLELYNWMELAIKNGGKIYYCDTDSLITDVELPTGTGLGQLKDVIPEGIVEAVFLRPKMYSIRKTGDKDNDVKMKGFPKYKEDGKEKLFTYNDFKTAYISKDMSKFNYKRQKFALPFESMKRNNVFLSMLEVSKRVISTYDKREVIANLMTTPLTIDEKEEA